MFIAKVKKFNVVKNRMVYGIGPKSRELYPIKQPDFDTKFIMPVQIFRMMNGLLKIFCDPILFSCHTLKLEIDPLMKS